MRKANAPTTLSDKVEKLRLKNNVLILARSPASIKSTYCTGRSSDLFRLSRLPSFHQWQRERQTKFRSSEWNSQQQALFGIYTRFPFHFSRRSVTQSSVCDDKDRKKFLDCTLWRNYFFATQQTWRATQFCNSEKVLRCIQCSKSPEQNVRNDNHRQELHLY